MRVSMLDPCAGEGAAIEQVVRILTRGIEDARIAAQAQAAVKYREAETGDEDEEENEDCEISCADIYSVEMEHGRHKMLSGRSGFSWRCKQRALHGDAFCVNFAPSKDSGVGLLYLNPPYDLDKVHGRMEQRFLRRFTAALAPGGVLVFIVPYHALAASAATFATRYEDVSCYRFAGVGFNVYKQVVVFAKKLVSDRVESDGEIRDLVNLWAARGAECPELPDADKPHRRARYVVPMHDKHTEALGDWKMKVVDATALLGKFVPWHETVRRGGLQALARVVPGFSLVDVMHRTYEVATPPRPAHIAAGLAAGLFNGQRIEPDLGTKLPALLVKGCFDREWRTVEEKKDKYGETKAIVQVQQPKLVITVLDLDEHKYHTLGATLEKSGAKTVSGMGISDILEHYGKSLMAVMEKQCEILYDSRYDGGSVEVADSPRELYQAQEHAVKALVKILREKPGELPLLSAEIGSGKSTISLMTAKTMGAKRILVLCPPHLLDSWRNEVKAVVPEAEYRVIESISDIEKIDDVLSDKMLVAVLSRETAKLGHRLEGVSGTCPACGASVATDAEDLAKKRSRCGAQEVVSENEWAKFARSLALYLRTHSGEYLPERLRPVHFGMRCAAHGLPAAEKTVYAGLPDALLCSIREALVEACKNNHAYDSPVKKALAWAIVAGGAAPETVLDVARRLKPEYHDYGHFAESFLLLLPPGGALGAAFELLETFPKPRDGSGSESSVDWFKKQYAKNADASAESGVEEDVGDYSPHGEWVRVGGLPLGRNNGEVTIGGHKIGSVEAASELLRYIGSLGVWSLGPACGEHLYQSTPEPRRYPLAKYIVRRHKQTFDFVIADEIQEYANDSSAQTIAAHRLVALRKPMIFMTGTIINGYAKSVFPTMIALSTDFRNEFDRGDLSTFVDRYGYRKRILSDKEDGEIVAFGTQSDRVERSERDAGDAPGVLPLFLFRHLLASTVTLHKADLKIDLPTLTQDRDVIVATPSMQAEYSRILDALKTQIKADMFEPGLAGKLFGQLSEFPSYLDCCTEDVGNVDGGGSFEIRYPEGLPDGFGNRLVAAGEMLPASTVLPKEAKMLAFVEAEVAAGRNVMVLGWHLRLLPRLARLLAEKIGESVPVLYADKVPTGKRQAWIEREIVGKKRRCLVVNPVCIQTGLNSLVHFSSQWWHEHPACNPLTFRQAVGRIDRIGQKQPTKTLFGYYGETLQEKIYDLLMAKVGISTAVDGLDPSMAWQAAGIVEDESLLGLSLGKALWDMMTKDVTNVVPFSRSRSARRSTP